MPPKQPGEEVGLALPGRHPPGFACIEWGKGLQDPGLSRLSLGAGHLQVWCPAFIALLLSLHPLFLLSRSERKGDSDSPGERFLGQWCREEPCL